MMKDTATEKTDRIDDRPATRDIKEFRLVSPSFISGSRAGVLHPRGMSILKVERQNVKAAEVFHSAKSQRGLQNYHDLMKRYEQANAIPPAAEQINYMTVRDGYIPEELSHQDMTGRALLRQAKYISGAPFFAAITSHPEFCDLPGFEIPKKVMKETLSILNLLRSAGNLFRGNKIQTVVGSPAELSIARNCFGSIWPAGINLYDILRELYPAFHARITGQVPECVANVLEDLQGAPVDSGTVNGLGRFSIDRHGRFLGLYPVCEVPSNQVTPESTFVAQDQLGRKAIVNSILEDILSVLQEHPDRPVIVIDYAGGVGNMAELLLKKIYDSPDEVLKKKILSRVRVAVIDSAGDQLAAGNNRFQQLNRKTPYAGIYDRIIFLEGDATRPLTAGQTRAMEARFGEEWFSHPLYLGMTSYTIGALSNMTLENGLTVAHAMADEMFKQCWKIYAVDFSSPMWRREGFLKDTGKWGREYLRAVHGAVDEEDAGEAMHRLVSLYLRLRFGVKLESVADFVRFMAIGGALASHYTTVWPDSDGHNAGYCVVADGTLKKPGILSFAERLQQQGATVHYQSRVRLFGTLDLGKTDGGNRAWAFIPGWIADFAVAENKSNRCR